MKRLFLIYSLILLATSAFAQSLFIEKYEKLRNLSDDDESFQIIRMTEKEIKEHLKTLDAPEEIKMFKNTKTLLILIEDIDEDLQSDKKGLNNLINQYEELLSFSADDIDIKILAETKKEKIKELIIVMNMDDEANFFVDVEFNKPIDIDSWMDLAGGINVNDISLSDLMNGTSSTIFNMNEPEVIMDNPEVIIIEEGGRYGAKDKNGTIIIPLEYEAIMSGYDISDGKHVYLLNDGKKGVADLNGIIISVEYDDISSYNIGGRQYIYLRKDDKYGIADSNGAIIIPVEYDGITPNYPIEDKQYIYLRKGDKYGLADLNGTIIIPVEYDTISPEDSLKFLF